MKAGTHGMVKFKRLQRRLGLPLWQAIGLLEALWTLTAKDAPCGDIGKFSNEDIAAWLEYAGDHDDLIAALVSSGWLDECEDYRLVVHDWAEHAPNFVKGNYRDKFVESSKAVGPQGTAPKGPPLEDTPQGTAPPSVAKCSVAKCSQEKPRKRQSPSSFDPKQESIPEVLDTPEFLTVWDAWCDHRVEIRKRLTPTSVRQQLAELAGWGERRAVAAIRHTIAKGWTGIREAEEANGKPKLTDAERRAASVATQADLAGGYDPYGE